MDAQELDDMGLTVGNQQILQWCSCHKRITVR